ncbi:Eco57I restriction-modification methylase domain-containing protein [Marseilla massiliensis]|uniref:Eco57I restriction-modification methylase domain-containing protein n=1 Tax=Marseilla massiliensis TaxID=1841864 RepID=UPI0030C7BC3C
MAVYTTIEPIEANTRLNPPGGRGIVLQPEQEQAVSVAFRYFKKGLKHPKFLWNAKMRFGKTLCALELARRMGELDADHRVRRTLIVTHRPVVNKSWKDDFEKIFGGHATTYRYGTKSEVGGEGDFYDLETSLDNPDNHYIFFASMQYLRRSSLVGGDNDEQLKKDLLQTDWDLVVIDEAHEGTRTNLGQAVIDMLTKDGRINTLHLSGTPFNLYEDFDDDQIYTWDYIKEQTAKKLWPKEHPNEPAANNPYRELPEMEIRTYDLGKLVKSSLGDDATFQFREFFRTKQGSDVPAADKGRFVHEDDVRLFLDLLCKDDEQSHYPFSTDEYREQFNHTLWVVPGVKEAKALERLLNDHEVFGGFDAIINVAGANDDDETREDALDKVLKRIGDQPEQTYTITISCGRLTTGVTVKPWTAVFYLKGSENTSAATYMQTIFRVQSPYCYEDDEGQMRMKTKCYVFDFAPDRSLKMVAETAKFATLTQKQKKYASAATTREKDIENMANFLRLCPVIAMQGGQMVEFKADRLFEQLEHVYVDRVVRNGFNDNSLYDIRALMALAPDEVEELDSLGKEIGKTTNMDKPKPVKNIDISSNKLTAKQQAAAERAKRKRRENQELTEEEKSALEAEKERKAEERKERDNRISVLRGISLRIPLMMFGAEIDNEDEGITLDNFTRVVDDDSWKEFMPRGVDKAAFRKFKKCYNATVFVAAGKRYRKLARQADNMHVDERVRRISAIFSYFHNPDKETVLTPWRVVNMHMSDCLGGYTFFNESFTGPCEKQVKGTNGQLFDWVTTMEPRFVDRGEVTREVFGRSDAKILEINSKTGLYPLYVAYSLYRRRCADFVEAGLIDNPDNYSVDEEQVIWDDILANNIYVICNTPMARRITRRTLLGFRSLRKKNGTEQVNIKSEKLISRAIGDREALVSDILSVGFWRGDNRNNDMLKFSAVVGNPPYQIEGISTRKSPIYHIFYELAFSLSDKVTLITPARFLYKAGQTPDEWMDKILEDPHFKVVRYFPKSTEVFPSVDIKGGVAITYYDSYRNFGKIGFFSEFKELVSILDKVRKKQIMNICAIISSRGMYKFTEKLFKDFPEASYVQGNGSGLQVTPKSLEQMPYVFKERGCETDSYKILGRIGNERVYRWIKKEYIQSNDYFSKYNVFVPEANGTGSFGEVLSTPIIGMPMIGHTDTFISVGKFDNVGEAQACLKYIKTKFARTMLGTLKATQHNPRDTWSNVPLQDFTPNSDIDWSKSIAEIDRQLYNKYGLTDEETGFIERMIKPME